jgi:signal transduction histidine kinase
VRERVQLSQESLFDFLSATGLPLVSRLVSVVRSLALALAMGSAAFAAYALLNWPEGLWNPGLPWGGALPALAAAPLYSWASGLAARRRMQPAALVLFLALYLFSVLASWLRGALSPSWYVQPFLALLATCCLGVVPGLTLTLVAVVVLLVAPWAGPDPGVVGGATADTWVHATSLAALTLASALTGALVHKLLRAALVAVESQRLLNLDSRRALRHRERLLRHAMRVDTVGDLAGLVGHQLRNAFQVMLGHVTLGVSGDEPDPSRRLTLVGEALQQTRPLLDQLMTLAHPDEGQPEPIDLDRCVAAFFARARCLMPSLITVRLERADAALPVLLDPRGLEHALWNLVINARQAMPEGGTIILRTGADGDSACVAVADTGCGIPPEVRQRIFDPYFTTKPPGQGTGLGLAAVDRFVRASKGRIDVETDVGRGSTFLMRFPLASEATLRSA